MHLPALPRQARRAILAGLVSVAASGAATALPAHAAAPSPAAERALQSLFDDDWRWRLQHQPEFATSLGESLGAERWDDHSRAALDAAEAHERALLARLDRIDRAALRGEIGRAHV